MKVAIKMTGPLYREIVHDLSRRHPFAAERVGFVFGRIGTLTEHAKLICLNRYHSIPDEQYVQDETVGARIGSDALTWAMQALHHGRPVKEGIFHFHIHPYQGETNMGRTDRRELPKLIPGFQSVAREAPHGIIILSSDHGSGWVWLPGTKEPLPADTFSVIGSPLGIFEPSVRQ